MKYSYRVEFSSRKTMSLSVSFDNKVLVRCPYNMSQSEIEAFVDSKEGWLEKHITYNINTKNAFNDVLSYKKILLGGLLYELRVGYSDNICGNVVFVKNLKNLKKLLTAHCRAAFMEAFYNCTISSGLNANSVGFKDYKSRWGCCDGRNNMVFNYKLLMLPKELQIYVITHELCHTYHHNHSKAFWDLVEQMLPDYKRCRKKLKEYAFLSKLY